MHHKNQAWSSWLCRVTSEFGTSKLQSLTLYAFHFRILYRVAAHHRRHACSGEAFCRSRSRTFRFAPCMSASSKLQFTKIAPLSSLLSMSNWTGRLGTCLKICTRQISLCEVTILKTRPLNTHTGHAKLDQRPKWMCELTLRSARRRLHPLSDAPTRKSPKHG